MLRNRLCLHFAARLLPTQWMCARVFAANIKFINWMLCIRNCEAFEHYNGDLTQLFIIVAFQWLALSLSLCSLSLSLCLSIQQAHGKGNVGSQIDVAVAVIVWGTDSEIESYKYIVCTNICGAAAHRFEMNLLLGRIGRMGDGWWHKRPNGGYFKCNCSRRNSKTNLIHFTVYFLDAFIYLWM